MMAAASLAVLLAAMSWQRALGVLDTSFDPQLYMTTEQMAEAAGYGMESHVARTLDGFLLKVHRLMVPYRTPGTRNKGPVLLMHGIFGASDNWIITGPRKALGYLLADEGYDVFIGNFRGNFYSRRHVTLSPRDPQFWRFSWQEMGEYDLPAILSLVQRVSGARQGGVLYIGHSMGVAALAVMMTNPSVNANLIRGAVCLAPGVYIAPPVRPFPRFLLNMLGDLSNILRYNNEYELLPRSLIRTQLLQVLCGSQSLFHNVCVQLFSQLTGKDQLQLDTKRLPAILTHILSGTSADTPRHYAQNHKADKFQAFDHGMAGNLRRYGQPWPPQYDLRRIRTPVAVYYALNDQAIRREEAERFYKQLPKKRGFFQVQYQNFTHLDFLLAKDAKPLVYDHLIQLIKTM